MKNFTILSTNTIKRAFETLNKCGKKCLIVTNNKNQMLGTLTDGDIRKAILKKHNLEDRITNIYNKNGKYIYNSDFKQKTALTILLKNKIDILPILTKDKKVLNIVELSEIFKKINKKPEHKKIKNCPLVIMAGGFGTRLKPFTDVLPKALIPLNNKAVIEHIINKFQNHGIKNIFLSINYKAEIIKAYFYELKLRSKIKFIEENKKLGTCGSLSLLLKKIGTNFFVTNCDTIVDLDYFDFYSFHKKNRYDLTLVASAKKIKIPYGVCHVSKKGELETIKEKPVLNNLINAGLYILKPNVLKLIPKNKKFDFNQLINLMIKKKKRVGIYPIDEKALSDVGNWPEFKKIHGNNYF